MNSTKFKNVFMCSIYFKSIQKLSLKKILSNIQGLNTNFVTIKRSAQGKAQENYPKHQKTSPSFRSNFQTTYFIYSSLISSSRFSFWRSNLTYTSSTLGTFGGMSSEGRISNWSQQILSKLSQYVIVRNGEIFKQKSHIEKKFA